MKPYMLNVRWSIRHIRDTDSAPGRRTVKRPLSMILILLLLLAAGCSNAATKEDVTAPEVGDQYTLDKVVVLSRHNIRSPLSGSGSLLSEITPHTWFSWSSDPSELSVRGGVSETILGQYFRQWLEEEGLFPKNYQPEDGAVRFYSNAKQRTIATSTCFSAGLLPVWNTPVETHVEYDTMDPTFTPKLNFVTPAYEQDVVRQISEMGGEAGLDGIREDLRDEIALLMDVADIKESESYQSGACGSRCPYPAVL